MANVEPLAEELDPEAVRIGTAIREFRKARGLTLIELGAAVGRTHSYLSKVERGHSKASITLCYAIADALDIRRAALLSPALTSAKADN